MAGKAGGFLRNNVFLVAAVALPVVVVAFFLLASAIPRWTVPAPKYDLLLKAGKYGQVPARLAVEFKVRDGQLVTIARPVPREGYYEQPWALFVFEHDTLNLREIPLKIPDSLPEGSEPQTRPVEALADRRILEQSKAPDGYELRNDGYRGGPGLVGDLFGMRGSYDRNVAIVNNGRVISIPLPTGYQYLSPVDAIGWLTDTGQSTP